MESKVHVSNLPYDTTESAVRDHFSAFGAVHSVTIITDPRTGRSRCFGFIDMENAEEAIERLNEKEFGGRKLRVSKAIRKETYTRPYHSSSHRYRR